MSVEQLSRHTVLILSPAGSDKEKSAYASPQDTVGYGESESEDEEPAGACMCVCLARVTSILPVAAYYFSFFNVLVLFWLPLRTFLDLLIPS